MIKDRKVLYEAKFSSDEICELQLRSFNRVWSQAQNQIDFYSFWKRKHHLPEKIQTLEDLRHFPLLAKKDLNENQEIIFNQFKKFPQISTGGSTGEPTRFPIQIKDTLRGYADAYMARSWWGMEPLEKNILFWGHSHLFGSGLKGRINDFKRRFKDKVIRTIRLNAYDMCPETIENYYEIVARVKPAVIVGYTSCIYKLARFMIDHGLEGTLCSGLKAVIPTAETVSENDVVVMEKAFLRPIVVEYGMAETGVIAYSRRETWDMAIFWDSFLARVNEEDNLSVTSLSRRLFPLINYQTDDRILPQIKAGESVLSFSKLQGRSQENFTLATELNDPLLISGILIVHIMKGYPFIYSVQTEQLPFDRIRIHLISDRKLDLNKIKVYCLTELSKDYSGIDKKAVSFHQSKSASLSLAGKERVIK